MQTDTIHVSRANNVSHPITINLRQTDAKIADLNSAKTKEIAHKALVELMIANVVLTLTSQIDTKTAVRAMMESAQNMAILKNVKPGHLKWCK